MVDRPSAGLLRSVATRRIVRALEQDGFAHIEPQGTKRIPYVLRNLLIGTGWIETDLRRLELVR